MLECIVRGIVSATFLKVCPMIALVNWQISLRKLTFFWVGSFPKKEDPRTPPSLDIKIRLHFPGKTGRNSWFTWYYSLGLCRLHAGSFSFASISLLWLVAVALIDQWFSRTSSLTNASNSSGDFIIKQLIAVKSNLNSSSKSGEALCRQFIHIEVKRNLHALHNDNGARLQDE